MDDAAGVFAEEPWLELFDGSLAGEGTSFEDGLAEPGDAFIGGDLEEKPAWFDEEGFNVGDLHGSVSFSWWVDVSECR